MENPETIREYNEINYESTYGKFLKEILDFYVPLLVQLPTLRSDQTFMEAKVKATNAGGIEDVATAADIWMQDEIKKHIRNTHPDWQFWGEEGIDATQEIKNSGYLFITDPIEGTNNFRAAKDAQWGSVASLVDMENQEPILGIIAQPMQKRIFVGIKNEGAFELSFDDTGNIVLSKPLSNTPEQHTFTYNNSPHFRSELQEQVAKFQSLGTIEQIPSEASELECSRPSILIEDTQFEDVESGALEPMMYRGGIMFKTNLEMAAVFAIAAETGAQVTDANGDGWSPNLNTLIFARNEKDWKYLKSMYDQTT